MKKIGIGCLMILFSLTLLACNMKKQDSVFVENGITYNARIKGKAYQIYKDGRFQDTFLTGVNMGAALPGSFPGEMAITKPMYLEWFQMIHEMNADVIRVYTTQMPHFYEALYEFNQTVDRPLYLMQGVWLNETKIKVLEQAYANNSELLNEFIDDGKDLVDAIHGNAILDTQPGFASGHYTYDVSEYVIGWIIGIEWSPDFVHNTNALNEDMAPYQGTYLTHTSFATPFEIFLTEVGDAIIDYEAEKYQFMRPLSFVNWPTTDHLTHPNEPDDKEDMVSVNMNHIQTTSKFYPGFFASFHVYPYYPEFLNYSLEYENYIDQNGKNNLYQGYLTDLMNNLDMPLIIAEFGVPASRGKTHTDANRGFDQGYLSEIEQGEMNKVLLEDIYAVGSAGGFLFTWQDEWFKRTWNTMDLDVPHRRPLWSNVQTNEQHFGLLAFDPGDAKSPRYVDGDITDWANDNPIYSDSSLDLYTAFDERYMYILVESKTQPIEDNRLIIPIATHPQQGNDHILYSNISFTTPVDFYIDIQGQSYGEVFVDVYYDPFYYIYHEQLGLLVTTPINRIKNTGRFNPIFQALSASLFLPQESRTIPFEKHRTGLLTYGNANPQDDAYHSLADYIIEDTVLEIRIPWLLLNISDPSSKQRLQDFYKNNRIASESINTLQVGAAFVEENTTTTIDLVTTSWQSWDTPTYHMRLKPSYYILKDAFKEYK